MNLYALLFAAAMVVGCSSSNDVSLQENSPGNTDSILDRTWKLTTVQDSSGNQKLVTQEADFEFTIRLASSFVSAGDDVVQEVMSVGGMNVCNVYGGGYTLESEILTLINVSEDSRSCERADEESSKLFSRVLFTTDNAAMVSLEDSHLVITSGNNEKLILAEEESVAFNEFHSGDLAFREDLTFNQPRYQVIRTSDELSKLYTEALTDPSCGECDWEPLDFVDFETSTVVFVAHEIVGNGGHSIKIENIYLTSDGLRVEVVKTTPGSNCAVSDAFTGPYVLYKLAGIFNEIDFVEFVGQDIAC